MDLVSRFRSLWSSRPSRYDRSIAQGRSRVRPSTAVDYTYEPLPDTSHIRILTLDPGNFKDDLVVHLNTSKFSAGSPPEYEAISYTWGSEADKAFVYAGDAQTTIKVPQNLDIALRFLRFKTKPRRLWADSICIEQNNDVEKGAQVAIMSQIFGKATRVLFWLGPEDESSSLAMDLMHEIGSQVVVNWPVVDPNLVRLAIRPAPFARNRDWGDEEKAISLKKHEALAIYELTTRAWFRRLWICQEIQSASDQSIILCGESQVLWTTFRYALTVLWRKEFDSGTSPSVKARFEEFESDLISLCYHQKSSFSQLRARYGAAECKDPRDRIYAVLSQATPESLVSLIRPDYTRCMEDIYQDVTLGCFYQEGNRNILGECRWHPDSSLPSWVPDWSRKEPFRSSMAVQEASSGLISGLSFTEPNQLALDVVIITKPTRLFSISVKADSARHEFLEQFAGFLDHIRSRVRLETTEQGVQRVLKKFTQALMTNLIAEKREPNDGSSPSLSSSIECLSHLLRCEGTIDHLCSCELDEAVQPFVSRWQDLLVERKLFTTPEGHVGVVPAYTREDDLVCIIVGHAYPVVLRHVGNEQYILIGSCFVPGFENGEAILGPLPDDVESVFFTNVGKWLFRNKDTGVVSYEDPRYCKLPIDLEPFRKSWRDNRKIWLIVDAATLQAAGVQVRRITLI